MYCHGLNPFILNHHHHEQKPYIDGVQEEALSSRGGSGVTWVFVQPFRLPFIVILFLAVQNSSISDPGFRSLTHSLTDYITELPTFDCPVFTAQYALEANGGRGVAVPFVLSIKITPPPFLVQFQS